MVLGTDLFAGGAFAGALIALGAMAIVVALIVYIYFAIALMTIAKKTKTRNSWMAWIPIANYYLITQIAGVSWLWTFALLLVFVPVIGGLAFWVATIWLFWRISETRKFPGWLGILIIVPGLNLVILGILAWAKK